EGFIARLSGMDEVGPPEPFIEAFAQWTKPSGGSELCVIVGSLLEDDAMGWVKELTADLRDKMSEPNAIVIDETEFGRLGIAQVGDTGEINNGHKVRVVGTVHGVKSLAGPYIFCSVSTARRLLNFPPDQTVYLLARCRSRHDAPAVVERLRERGYDDMSVFTAEEFSLHSRLHWLLKTKAGGALGYAALLGLMVGAVVTYQTLKSATAASMREYATLLALGIP